MIQEQGEYKDCSCVVCCGFHDNNRHVLCTHHSFYLYIPAVVAALAPVFDPEGGSKRVLQYEVLRTTVAPVLPNLSSSMERKPLKYVEKKMFIVPVHNYTST